MRQVLLLVGVVVCLAGAGGIFWFLGGARAGAPEEEASAPVIAGALPPPEESELGRAEERVTALAPPSLAVTVTDGEGAAVLGARLEARGPDGARVAADAGTATWRDLAPGRWVVEASGEGFQPRSEEIDLGPGEDHELTLSLGRGISVEGSVRDLRGKPKQTAVWFLRDGETHPKDEREARGRLTARPNAEGRFEIALAEAGSYRVTAGAPGRPELEAPAPTRVEPGSAREVEVVLPLASVLEVSASFPSDHVDGVTVEVLELAEAPAPNTGAPEPEPEPDPEAEEADGEEKLGALAALGYTGPPWIRRQSAPIPATGTVEIEGLRAGAELRLALVYRGVRAEQTDSFILGPESLVHAEVGVPVGLLPPAGTELADGGADEASEQPQLVLHVRTLARPLSADGRSSGVYWK